VEDPRHGHAVEERDELPDPAQDRDGDAALGDGDDGQPLLLDLPRRPDQAGGALLAQPAEQLPGGRVGDRHRRADVDAAVGLDREHRPRAALVAEQRELLLERHPLLLGEGQQRAGFAARVVVHAVLVGERGDLLRDVEAGGRDGGGSGIGGHADS
jgi:hypothetical protein